MYISTNWIRDFVNLDGLDIEKLIYNFTMSTAEVEGYEVKGKNTNGIVVGKILSVENIENSKKLHKLMVDVGKEKLQIVCGAPNVKENMKVPVALVGSMVQGEKISKAKLAGVDSYGMCMSEKELGISDDHSGLMVLDDYMEVGHDVKEYVPVDDIVFEVDNKSLTNRPDLWGHYGMAREFATITGRKLKKLELEDLVPYDSLEKINLNYECKDESNPLLYRYSALRVENVTRRKSSWVMKTRLYYCGMRAINLLADMTNYIMLELGQPMHAFDDSIVGGINVRQLDENTKFTTLDSKERTLEKGTLVICDGSTNEPVAIAGVMGGLKSEITDSTTKLLLESATFDAMQIRKTATKLDLRTDAAAHYEKTLDPELTKIAIERFIYLLKKEDKDIKVTSSFTDLYVKKYPHIKIDITKEYIDKKIGKELDYDFIVSTLKSLEFKVRKNGDKLTLDVPSFRATKDISQKADIVEEIARIYGFDNIEPKTNLWKVEPVRKDAQRELEYSAKDLLATKYGMSEIHSYVWYNTELNNELQIEVEDNLKITNAIAKLDSTLRREMAPTLLYAIHKNLKYMDEASVFEVGHVFNYNFDGKNAEEHKVLGIGVSSTKKKDKELVYELKNAVEDIIKINKNLDVKMENMEVTHNWMHPNNTFKIEVNGQNIGYITVVHPKIKDNINPKASICIAEVRIDKIGEIAKRDVIFKEVSKYQTVDFDLSLIVDKELKYSDVQEVINKADMKYLQLYKLIDVFENSQKLFGKKVLTVRFTIGSYDKTLTKEEIDNEREVMVNTLKENKVIDEEAII